MTIWNNDEARAFFLQNGYPENYNDGMLAWLRNYYNTTGSNLPDLLFRYIKEVGLEFASGNVMWREDFTYMLREDNTYMLREGS